MRGLSVPFILDLGYSFPNGVSLAVRSDLGMGDVNSKKKGSAGTTISDFALTFEYDVNFRPRERAKAK